MCLCVQLSDGLRHTEGQFSEGGVSGAGDEPDWLRELRQRFHGRQVRLGEDLWAVKALFGFKEVKILIWKRNSDQCHLKHIYLKTQQLVKQNSQNTILFVLLHSAEKLAAILKVVTLKDNRIWSVLFIIGRLKLWEIKSRKSNCIICIKKCIVGQSISIYFTKVHPNTL